MSDDKPFEPTRSRLARARREGDVPRSQDVTLLAAFGSGALACACSTALAAWAAAHAVVDAAGRLTGARSAAVDAGAYVALGTAAATVALAANAGAAVAAVAQSGRVVFRLRAPSFAALDPRKGLQRVCSRDALFGGAKATLVAATVAATAAGPVRVAFLRSVAGAAPPALAANALAAAATLAVAAIAIGAAFAAADVLVERAKWRRRLRMSFDDVRREHRQTEGDPHVRGRRRTAHRNLVRGSVARVAEAAFVVANPTHVAIAFAYRPPEIAVPRVVVRAIDAGARAVRRRAERLGIPVFEEPELARALLGATALDDAVPAAFYEPLARIVAALLATERRRA